MALRVLIVFAALLSFAACSSKTIRLTYKKSAELDCTSIGSKVKFYITKPNATEPEPLQSNEQVVVSDNKVLFKDLRAEQIKPEYYCESEDSRERLTFVKEITPFLVKPEKPSQTITQGGYAEFTCQLLYGAEKPETVRWEWHKAGQPIEIVDAERVKITNGTFETKLFIKNVGEQDKGEYQCLVFNQYDNATETIILRVKNPLAALWPFLAIVGEVIVLCVIILLYEKKCTKKNNNEEDNEQTQPMMRDGQNSELKKRTAKA